MLVNQNPKGGFGYLFPELTEKQYFVLMHFSNGTAIQQIAKLASVSEPAIRKQMDAIRTKYDCASSSDLRSIYISRTNTAIGEAIFHLMPIK
ncbi:helix-turn-helix transcriptional regulator [Vibrio cholerae]|nr:helix-turn-helix transcriptional regulator [Vibrio cholerae]